MVIQTISVIFWELIWVVKINEMDFIMYEKISKTALNFAVEIIWAPFVQRFIVIGVLESNAIFNNIMIMVIYFIIVIKCQQTNNNNNNKNILKQFSRQQRNVMVPIWEVSILITVVVKSLFTPLQKCKWRHLKLIFMKYISQ